MTVLVTDGAQRPALAITRSLGRRGIAVLVGEEQPSSLASASRYCAGHVSYPSPYKAPASFQQFLLSCISRERVDVVIPVTDVTTHLVARLRPALRGCATTAPAYDAFDLVSDKAAVLERARACGIAVPRTHGVNGLASVRALATQLEYPIVVKPTRSRIAADAGWIATTVHHVDHEAELLRLYRETHYLAAYPSLIQERIVGPGLGLFVLFDHGRLVTAFAHRRLREKPPAGGVSVVCESVPIDEAMLKQAVALLEPLGWHGVAMLEYKQDRHSAIPYLMEVNGRFWGSLQLAVDAGVDFPYLAWQLATGGRPDPPAAYRGGLRSRWLLGDVDHLLARLRHSDRRLRLPDDAPPRWRALSDFVAGFGRRLRLDVERFDDWRPAFHELGRYIRDAASAGRARRGAFGRWPRWPRTVPNTTGESR